MFETGRDICGGKNVSRDVRGSGCIEGKRAAVATERMMEGGMKQPFMIRVEPASFKPSRSQYAREFIS